MEPLALVCFTHIISNIKYMKHTYNLSDHYNNNNGGSYIALFHAQRASHIITPAGLLHSTYIYILSQSPLWSI